MKYEQFEDEEEQVNDQKAEEIKIDFAGEGTSGKSKKKKFSKKMMNSAKRIVRETLQKSELYQNTKIEFQNQNKTQRVQTYLTCACCVYWMLNSCLGAYIIMTYDEIQDQHPQIYQYVLIFSSKWIISCAFSLSLMIITWFILKVCCRMMGVFQNTVGAFPIIYLFLIFVAYMYSLYFGIIILREIYLPEDKSEIEEYRFRDELELILLKIFVLNEIVVGAIIILQLIYVCCCGKISKSQHLNEIEGEGFGVDDEEVKRIKEELQESRKRTESVRKHEKVDISIIREEIRKTGGTQYSEQRIRSISHDPNQILRSYSTLNEAQLKNNSPTMKTNQNKNMDNSESKIKAEQEKGENQQLKLQLFASQQVDNEVGTGQNNESAEKKQKFDNDQHYQSNVVSTQVNQSNILNRTDAQYRTQVDEAQHQRSNEPSFERFEESKAHPDIHDQDIHRDS